MYHSKTRLAKTNHLQLLEDTCTKISIWVPLSISVELTNFVVVQFEKQCGLPSALLLSARLHCGPRSGKHCRMMTNSSTYARSHDENRAGIHLLKSFKREPKESTLQTSNLIARSRPAEFPSDSQRRLNTSQKTLV